MYSDKIIDHFKNPKNMGKMDDPTVKARVGNKICGDVMELTLKVEDDTIKDAKFQAFGCAPAIATCSIMTEMIKGKKLKEAKKMKPKKIDESLGGLPEVKKHCANLAFETLEKALDKHEKDNKKKQTS